LRFISRASDARSVQAALASTDFGATPIDVVYQSAGGKPTHFATHEGEQFLATSWTSLAALRFTAKPSDVSFISARAVAKKLSVASLASGETWRAWALANELPENNRPAELGGKPVPVARAIARIVVLADQSATPLSVLLTLRELEDLQVSLASQGLGLDIAVAGIDLGPLELIGGVVKALSPAELATTETFDFALDLGAGTTLRASLDVKRTPTISVSRSALVDEGTLASTLRELLQFSEVSR
jgi:hypothetical protein